MCDTSTVVISTCNFFQIFSSDLKAILQPGTVYTIVVLAIISSASYTFLYAAYCLNRRPVTTVIVHDGATFVTMDPPIDPNDTKTENSSSDKAEDLESLGDRPLVVGEHYLVRRNDDDWREYTHVTQ